MSVARRFLQNFGITIQNATQNLFFDTPKQANLHPFLAYVAEKIVPYSMRCFSDSLNHDAVSVNTFLKPVISYIKSVVPEIDFIKYFIDSAASQYKNFNYLFR